nr:hypothetical protein [Tanacetum cinerariifolium]
RFEYPPFKEEILVFIRDIGYSENIKSLSEVKVEILPQTQRTFGIIINKCISGKVIGLDLLRLSRAQILWGMYHQKNVEYVYLLWEDLIYQIENKVSKKNKDMYYPRFTKVIIDFFMSKDQSIPRRNKAIPKPKYVCRSAKEKTKQVPKASFDKRIKATTKVSRSGKKKQPANRLETLSKITFGLGTHEGTSIILRVPNVPTYGSDDKQISWKSSDKENNDEANTSKDDDDIVVNDDDDQDDDMMMMRKLNTSIDSILNVESTSLVNVPVTSNVEIPPSSTTTPPSLPIPFILPQQQTPVPTTINAPIASLQNLLTFGSLFKFEDRVKALEDKFLTLYKALVDAYEADKDILNTYGDSITLKRRQDDKDDDEEPSARSNRWSKRRKGKEHNSISAQKEKTSKSTGLSKEGPKSKTRSSGKPVQTEEPAHTTKNLEEPTHQEFKTDTKSLLLQSSRLSNARITSIWTGSLFVEMTKSCIDLKKETTKRLYLQDIEDMFLLLVQGKLQNLTIKERLALNVSLRMFTRSIVIRRCVEYLQLAYSNPRGFIYQNKEKKNILMRPDELYKFCDGTLNVVRTTLNDIVKEIQRE